MSSIKGSLVISLDFELLWGMLDKETASSGGERMRGARKAVAELTKLFSEYGIHATWGIVGSMLNDNVNELYSSRPERIPQYKEHALSSYAYYAQIHDEDSDCYFARDLVNQIKNTPGQEIASHTYSHYYALAQGQTRDDFESDIQRFLEKIEPVSSCVTSIIFPRNQINKTYVCTLTKNGFRNFRGNEYSWCCQTNGEKNSFFKRAFRLADAYISLTGPNCYGYDEIREPDINNIRSSRFLRPYTSKLALLEPLKIRRIKKQMLYAAENGKVFHLWWHPHNFGINLSENMKNLKMILEYYAQLKYRYGFESRSMAEIGNIVDKIQ